MVGTGCPPNVSVIRNIEAACGLLFLRFSPAYMNFVYTLVKNIMVVLLARRQNAAQSPDWFAERTNDDAYR
jgi:hypothetical protein